MNRIHCFTICILFTILLSCSRKSKTEKIIACAKSYLGTRYQFGGESRNGIDCSAFTQQSFACGRVGLYRRAVWQSAQGTYVPFNKIEKGNLVFFRKPEDVEISHVGLVIEGTGYKAKFIHASGRIGRVAISYLGDPEWLNIFVLAKDVR